MIVWNESDIDDYKRFPFNRVGPSEVPFFFLRDENTVNTYSDCFKTITYTYRKKKYTEDFDFYLERTKTTAFIAVKDDFILTERYYNGHFRSSMQRSFSVAKSYTGLMAGIAIDKGYISDIQDPFAGYISDLDEDQFNKYTIRDLLMMAAPFSFTTGPFPWNDDTIIYYSTDLRRSTTTNLRIRGKAPLF